MEELKKQGMIEPAQQLSESIATMNKPHILDSGERREFASGAVRDVQEGKGRCDLLPLYEVGRYFELGGADILDIETNDGFIFECIGAFLRDENRDINYIYSAISAFISIEYDGNGKKAILELSKHYEEGARKYDERNWEKGIPLHCYIDSGIRHLLKWMDGWEDEPHGRAFLWNMFGLLWTLKNKPECNDLPKYEKE